MKNTHNTLYQALHLTDRILAAIDKQALETVESLEKERSLLIQKYYREQDVIDTQLTLQLKQKNDQIVESLKLMQQQTQAQQVKLKQSGKISKAYLDNA